MLSITNFEIISDLQSGRHFKTRPRLTLHDSHVLHKSGLQISTHSWGGEVKRLAPESFLI